VAKHQIMTVAKICGKFWR